MASPWKHPKTGMYWFRKAVPKDLRRLVGKREEKRSLRTKDPREAKRLHAENHVEVLGRWENLRKGSQRLSHRECEALGGVVYTKLVEWGNRDRSVWSLQRAAFSNWYDDAMAGAISPNDDAWPYKNGEKPDFFEYTEGRYGHLLDQVLAERGLIIDPASRRGVLDALFRACRQAFKQIANECMGDYRPDPDLARFPKLEEAIESGYTLDDAWAAFKNEHKPAASTKKRWTPAVEGLKAFAGTNMVSRFTVKTMIDWKNHLLAKGLDPATVRNAYIGAIKAVLNAAKANGKISNNPAVGIYVHVPKKPRTRARDLTMEEARTILDATLVPSEKRISAEHASARRWVPWICAYTGARVNEITQLRAQDVKQEIGIWVVHITPEAGTTKTRDFRDVPLHEHLIDQGFVEFAKAKRTGPLFYNPKRARAASRTHPMYVRMGQKLAEWVRELGVNDPEVDPNHGWRHLFKTVARKAGLSEDKIDAIEGHAPGSVGRKYGHFPPDVLWPEIKKIPRFRFDPPLATPSIGAELPLGLAAAVNVP